MHCPVCGHPNRASARFCGECAAPLVESVTCPSCGEAGPPGSKFCDGCGQALRGPAATAGAAATPAPSPEHLADKIRDARGALEGERKQVTVLFADVMGSMELAEQSGPEEWRAIMERFFALLSDGVHRFEGTVDKFTGDGIMALFGAPIAHEDHARRACHAALHLGRELDAYAGELRRAKGLSLSVRTGLNSGEVVVGTIGEDLEMAYTAVGHTVGLAQRMEQLAAPGKIYVTEHTASQVDEYFALQDLGEFQVKGASRPLRVHELTGEGAARGRLDVSRARGFSRFVGRDDELRTLESALEQAFAGEGQVVGIVGEPGVGKSRLCHEFAERRRAQGISVFHTAGQAHAKSVPLLPVLGFLRTFFGIGERDSDQTARERIAGRLLLLDRGFEDDLPLLFDFLAVPDPQRPAPRMDPEARQRRLLALMKRLTHARNAREPTVILFEDLHWIDPVSETFLANHVAALAGTRGLTVLNFRPEYSAPWMSRSYYRQIPLAPLGAEAVGRLLAELLGSDPSLDGLGELVSERTEGNPFFIEEVVQSLVEDGTLDGERGAYALVRPVDAAAVPATVQAVLAARIDRLGPAEKSVLQVAAVIGKEFPHAVLARVVELEPERLDDALRGLAAGELVYEQELYPEAIYAFKHPLTREVAYGSQLGEARARVHAAVARAIAEHQPERLEERAALLAQHWEAAGEKLEAARWHARAGAWAGSGDPDEASLHWSRVRELADALPPSDEATRLGLTARIASLQFGWRLGISHAEAARMFEEADAMASRAGDTVSRTLLLQVYGALRGVSDGDMRESADLARRSIALADEAGDAAPYPQLIGSAYALYCVGRPREGIAVCDRAIAAMGGDPASGAVAAPFASPYGYSQAFKGVLVAELGGLGEGCRLVEHGRRIAREDGDLEVVGFTHLWSSWLSYRAGEPAAALADAQRALESAERAGGSFSHAQAWTFLGTAEVMRGEWRRAIEALDRSRAISRTSRTAVEQEGWRLALLAEAHLGLGEVERARELAAEGLEVARAQGHLLHEANASIALARVLLGSAGVDERSEIEAALARALEIADETGARVLEPLVHVELAELARQGGDTDGQKRELRLAHSQFTEIGATGHAERLAAELGALAG